MQNPENIANVLKIIINKNGPSYLTREPYTVYKELGNGGADRETSAAVLYILTSGVMESIEDSSDVDFLSTTIRKKCCLNKKLSDSLAMMLHCLYSDEHKREWKNKELEGLRLFLKENLTCQWKGFAVWDAGDGTVDCHFDAEIVIKPTDKIAKDAKLKQLLEKNPFTTKDEICEFYIKRLKEYLDYEFDFYCTEDDYYQPVVEDFGCNLEYDLPHWCEENGFEYISFDGDGSDDGYEPKSRGYW